MLNVISYHRQAVSEFQNFLVGGGGGLKNNNFFKGIFYVKKCVNCNFIDVNMQLI